MAYLVRNKYVIAGVVVAGIGVAGVLYTLSKRKPKLQEKSVVIWTFGIHCKKSKAFTYDFS